MSTIKFSDIKPQLQQILQEKLNEKILPDEGGFVLIEGFMALPIQSEISNNIVIGVPNIPTVGIVGNKSGRIYTFALKAILPNIEI